MIVRPYPVTAWTVACALGADTAAVRETLRAGRSGLQPVGEARGLPFDTWFGALPVEDLPALPAALAERDTLQARMAAHLTSGILAAARGAVARWGADRVGVILGTTTGGIADTEARYPDWTPEAGFPDGYDLARQHAMQATSEVVGALVGATGPRWAQSSACSSSTKVFGSARRLLDLGVVDAVLVGGIDTWCRFTQLGFRSLEVLSSRRCAPFAADRDGINLGEGGALVLLERQGEARAWLHGVGETSDAHHMTQPHPEGAGLGAAIRRAVLASGISARDVDLVQAHATGTPLNDRAESLAIARELPHGPLVVGTKGYTGHTLGACGAVEAALCLLALEEGWCPGTLTRAPLDPELAVRVSPDPVTQRFRYALNLSAAFAGHNGAVLLEAA
ncbi:MAG: beta-ketoacyl-[acyl-carrier-protein] synthase II [Alphaproteobacteria bacterium]|nr:beta-ketoacyl-[acyl-carrier-protein] synthase II [Alphaproteobacteria bacterium]